MTAKSTKRITLVRHGQTDWAREGRHTGRADIALNAVGEAQARRLAGVLAEEHFAAVFVSPLQRARRTLELSGVTAPPAMVLDNLREWNYGSYEGRTTEEIQQQRPGWTIWGDGVPDGESIGQLGERADAALRVIEEVEGPVLVVAHGHLLRVLTSRWCGRAASFAAHLSLDPASVSRLGEEREIPGILSWNDTHHLRDMGAG